MKTESVPAPLARYLKERGYRPQPFQVDAWRAFAAGESGLVHAPTGSGKTLAAFGGPAVDRLERGGGSGLELLWITPLRALATDLAESLSRHSAGLDLDWRIEKRTGDTSGAVRRRQREQLPGVLVTTPESLSVLLSHVDSHDRLAATRCVVVDEWHELLGSKRGIQLELALARLRTLNPSLQTWGLSATLSNLPEAMTVLLGPGAEGRLVHGHGERPTIIESLRPPSLERFPWAGHLGLRQLDGVIAAIERAATTLVFTNTRSQAELWYQAILERRGDWLDRLALHHGSIDRRVRERIEDGIRAGALKAVVCTSSLDLGVDFAPVEQVVQVGSPKGVARLLQRAGRSGHRPGQAARVLCVPTHAFELVEIAAARAAHAAGRIEARTPLRGSLDVLAQHLVTLAAGPGFEPDVLLAEVRRTHAFAGITADEWSWVLDFVRTGGTALSAYPRFRRVTPRDGRWVVDDVQLARRHRYAIGTITSDASLLVRYVNGPAIGHVEETFASRLKPGDSFLFAGRLLRLVRVRDMVAWVRRATQPSGPTPRWAGGRMSLSTELADTVLRLIEQAGAGDSPVVEINAVRPLLELQARWSSLPRRDLLVAERTRTREGWHLFVYPFAGRSAHQGMATLLAWRLAAGSPATYALAWNDYGFELTSAEACPVDAERLRELLSPADLARDLEAGLNFTEVARRRFRDIARIAGLVQQGPPGRAKSSRQLQASSSLVYDVLARYDAGNLLLSQASREVLEQELESTRLAAALERTSRQQVRLNDCPHLTPLAFPLWADGLASQVLSTESWQSRVQRMVQRLERAADTRASRSERRAAG